MEELNQSQLVRIGTDIDRLLSVAAAVFDRTKRSIVDEAVISWLQGNRSDLPVEYQESIRKAYYASLEE